MNDSDTINRATLQIHVAINTILEKELGRSPAHFEVAQAAAVTYGEATAFLCGAGGGDVSVIAPLDLIAKTAFAEIAGPKTLEALAKDG